MQIGYLGLGVMGGALARRLQQSRRLVVFDLDPAAVARLVESGAEAARDPVDLAGRCEVIFVCLPTSDHVRKAIFGADGLAGGLRHGTILIDQTTGDPAATRAMARELEAMGVELVDAPVSGGAMGAEAGTIAVMVGASEAQFERLKPVFADISPNIFHAGGIGNGHVIKLVNNLISGVQRLLTQEGMALAAKNGVDPERAADILLAGGGRNAYMEKILAPRVLKGRLAVGFTLGLAHKDVRLACELGADTGVPTPFGDLAAALYQSFVDEAGYNAEVETSGLITEQRAGTRYIPEDHTI